MTYLLVIFYITLWILLGIFADKICERQAKKESIYYEGTVQIACYIAGPVIIPLALLLAFRKGVLNMFRS